MKWTNDTCRPLATELVNIINQRLPELPAGKLMTARQVCGKHWDTLNSVERRFAGRFISACVRRGMFPLEQLGRNSANHWLYRRRQPSQSFNTLSHGLHGGAVSHQPAIPNNQSSTTIGGQNNACQNTERAIH
jgi:hypothetical protein